jgi:hypothetical protein
MPCQRDTRKSCKPKRPTSQQMLPASLLEDWLKKPFSAICVQRFIG